jgi:hypothetical protein
MGLHHEPQTIAVLDKYAVGDDEVEVYVQVHQTAEALDRLRHRPLPHAGRRRDRCS